MYLNEALFMLQSRSSKVKSGIVIALSGENASIKNCKFVFPKLSIFRLKFRLSMSKYLMRSFFSKNIGRMLMSVCSDCIDARLSLFMSDTKIPVNVRSENNEYENPSMRTSAFVYSDKYWVALRAAKACTCLLLSSSVSTNGIARAISSSTIIILNVFLITLPCF